MSTHRVHLSFLRRVEGVRETMAVGSRVGIVPGTRRGVGTFPGTTVLLLKCTIRVCLGSNLTGLLLKYKRRLFHYALHRCSRGFEGLTCSLRLSLSRRYLLSLTDLDSFIGGRTECPIDINPSRACISTFGGQSQSVSGTGSFEQFYLLTGHVQHRMGLVGGGSGTPTALRD